MQDLKEESELGALASFRGLVVVHFWAPWSQACLHMNEVMVELAKEHASVKFLKVEAEEFPTISLKHEIVAVPTFLFMKGGEVVDRIDGAHVPELTKKTALHSEMLVPPTAAQPAPKQSLDERLKTLINASRCMLFMKGTPQEPKCGFSRELVALLTDMGAEFGTFNILADEEVRQGLKKFSNWPTYPQVYIGGELIGGLDILKELKESGELGQMLPKTQSLDERLKELIRQKDIMAFIKGSPESPRCKFSRALCEILSELKVEFASFDILEDEEVRQGLKKYSNWPTFPQVYVRGELIGGLDIIKELRDNGELQDVLK